jgi:hypothetical protein
MATAGKADRFLDGIECYHGDEIALAHRIHSALLLTIGKAEAQSLARSNPAKLFRALRYGRRFHFTPGLRPAVSSLVDSGPLGNKPSNAHILTPDSDRWGDACSRIGRIQAKSRYIIDQDGNPLGFHAAAEAFSALGVAVAESLVVAMLFGAENDDSFAGSVPEAWQSKTTETRSRLVAR